MVFTSHKGNQLPEKMFGNNAPKANLTYQISPNPLVAFCRKYKNQKFTGDKLSGFATKFCNDFYLAPTHTGICIAKNLDLSRGNFKKT